MNLPTEEKEKYLHFLELLRQTPRDWFVERVVAKGAIRRVHFPPTRHLDVECPISSIERRPIGDFMAVAGNLKLDDSTMQMILRAADFSGPPPVGCIGEPTAADVAECRRDLMRNCGLTHLLTAGTQPEITVEETQDAVLAL